MPVGGHRVQQRHHDGQPDICAGERGRRGCRLAEFHAGQVCPNPGSTLLWGPWPCLKRKCCRPAVMSGTGNVTTLRLAFCPAWRAASVASAPHLSCSSHPVMPEKMRRSPSDEAVPALGAPQPSYAERWHQQLCHADDMSALVPWHTPVLTPFSHPPLLQAGRPSKVPWHPQRH